MSPHIFLLGFAFGEVPKLNVMLSHLYEEFSCQMLHIAMLMFKQSLVWYR